MAEKSASEKTEAPTPERLRKAREEGQVPVSQEVPTALIIVMLLVSLAIFGPGLCDCFIAQVQQGLTAKVRSGGTGAISNMLHAQTVQCLQAAAPILIVIVLASVASSAVSSGWSASSKALQIKWDRLSPFAGAKNFFSLKSLVVLAVSIAKLVVVGFVVWPYVKDRVGEMASLQHVTPVVLMGEVSRMVLGVSGRLAAAMVGIAILDLLYQRWNHRKQLMMTRQEVKEERRQQEVSVEVKVKIRSLQTAIAKKRMLKSVPTADVVVVNPTHVAVALKYDPGKMEAPQVVAKGADFLCQTIKDIAAKHGVPIVEKPELARALYSTTKEGQFIPETMFVAVAEVLAMIFRLRKNRRK